MKIQVIIDLEELHGLLNRIKELEAQLLPNSVEKQRDIVRKVAEHFEGEKGYDPHRLPVGEDPASPGPVD